MNGTTIYHVQFGDGSNHYFGSIAAIFDHFSPDEIGITKTSLWTYGITLEKPYKNRICTIYKGVIYRKKGNRNNLKAE